MKSTLGTFIRALRKENNLTLKDLEKLSDISFSQIAKIERGEHTPSRKTIKKIADALSFEEDKLLTLAGYIPDNYELTDSSISPSDRYRTIIKYNGTCQICGAQAPKNPISVTYIELFQKRGENNHIDNLITICRNCLIARESLRKQNRI